MKTIIVTIAISLFSLIHTFGQTPPTPPSTHTTTSSSSSYSFTYDTDEKDSNSSISIKNNNDVYRFKASFNKSKTSSIKKMLLNHLGKKGLKITGKTYVWIKNNDGEEIFECKLTNGRLRVFVDKEYVSDKFYKEIEELGATLKDEISGHDSKAEAKERAEKALARAKKELERAKRDLERAKRSVKKH